MIMTHSDNEELHTNMIQGEIMIDINELSKLCERLGCRITPECSLSDYITFRFGGPCRALISVNSAKSAAELIRYMKANGIKYGILGRGSNVLVSDDGYDGVILLFGSDFSHMEINGNTIRDNLHISLFCDFVFHCAMHANGSNVRSKIKVFFIMNYCCFYLLA